MAGDDGSALEFTGDVTWWTDVPSERLGRVCSRGCAENLCAFDFGELRERDGKMGLSMLVTSVSDLERGFINFFSSVPVAGPRVASPLKDLDRVKTPARVLRPRNLRLIEAPKPLEVGGEGPSTSSLTTWPLLLRSPPARFRILAGFKGTGGSAMGVVEKIGAENESQGVKRPFLL